MKPAHTLYRLAHSPKDYGACHWLAAQREMPVKRLSWPTVVAERDGEVIGFLATQPRDDAIVAGPLAVGDVPRPLITIIRLIDAYENVLRAAGVSSYLFAVERDNPEWQALIDKAGEMQPHKTTEDAVWYLRRIV